MAFKTIRDLPAIPAVEHNLEITSDDFLMISNAIEGGSTYKISVKQLNDVLPVFTPSTATTIGIKGLVPAPQVGDLDEYLTSSGDWDIIPINERIKSGIVTAPETETSVRRRTYVNALKSWSTDADGKPGWRSWVDTIDVFTGPTASVDGKKGLVPAPIAGEGKEILRADGQWVLARDMISSVTVSATAPTDPVPKNGDLWFDTNSGSLFIYVEIASSWIEVSGGGGGGSNLDDGAVNAIMPVGSVISYAGFTAPTGWLLCDGRELSRTTYSDLFSAIGSQHGAGDGSTTFRIPDLRGRVVAGQDDMGGSSANRLTNQSGGLDGDILGATGGSETHTLSVSEIPAHTHTYNDNESTSEMAMGGSGARTGNTSANTGSTGGGGAHNNVQPTIILNYIIKYSNVGSVQTNGGDSVVSGSDSVVSGSDLLVMPSYIGPTVSGQFASINNNAGYQTVLNTSQELRLGNSQSSPLALGLSSAAVISVRIWGTVHMEAGGEADRLSPRVYMGTEPDPSSTGTQLFPSPRPWGNSTSAQAYDVTITDAFEIQPWDGGDATRVYITVSNNGNNSSGNFNIDYWIKDANFNIIQN